MSLDRYIPQISKFAAAVLLSVGAMGAQAAGQVQTVGYVDAVLFDAAGDLLTPGFEFLGVSMNMSKAITSNGSFAAFCLEPSEGYSTSASFTETNLADSAVQAETPSAVTNALAIAKLFSYAYDSVTNGAGDVQVANYLAFQAALWDLAFDDGNVTSGTEFSLTTGDQDVEVYAGSGFSYSGTQTIDLATLANGMLTGAASYSGPMMNVKLLYSSTNQNMVYAEAPVSAVPEPISSALMLGGLAAVGFVSRRRKLSA